MRVPGLVLAILCLSGSLAAQAGSGPSGSGSGGGSSSSGSASSASASGASAGGSSSAAIESEAIAYDAIDKIGRQIGSEITGTDPVLIGNAQI